MDPITLILTALAPIAAAGGQTVANEAIKDAYTSLKTLVLRKLTGKSQGQMILAEYEVDPETWKAPLKKILTEGHMDRDSEIMRAAQNVMQCMQLGQSALGKNIVQNSHMEGVIQGDNARQTNIFRAD